MEHSFKPGDWVIANGTGHTSNNPYFPLDKAFKVLSIDSHKYVNVDKSFPTVTGATTGVKDVRFAMPHEIPEEYRIELIYEIY